jgi:mono/diheme cytochrome c family protein
VNAPDLRTRAIALVVIAFAFTALAGCHPVRRSEPIVGPMSLADSNLLRGRLLFDRHCYKCHLEGEGGMGPIINDKPLPKFLMRFQVRVGLGTMPGFTKEQISDEELDAIVDYIVFLRHHYKSRSAAGDD